MKSSTSRSGPESRLHNLLVGLTFIVLGTITYLLTFFVLFLGGFYLIESHIGKIVWIVIVMVCLYFLSNKSSKLGLKFLEALEGKK